MFLTQAFKDSPSPNLVFAISEIPELEALEKIDGWKYSIHPKIGWQNIMSPLETI